LAQIKRQVRRSKSRWDTRNQSKRFDFRCRKGHHWHVCLFSCVGNYSKLELWAALRQQEQLFEGTLPPPYSTTSRVSPLVANLVLLHHYRPLHLSAFVLALVASRCVPKHCHLRLRPDRVEH
jgi:hypothetical protein